MYVWQSLKPSVIVQAARRITAARKTRAPHITKPSSRPESTKSVRAN